jgi:hypothetical protein
MKQMNQNKKLIISQRSNPSPLNAKAHYYTSGPLI